MDNVVCDICKAKKFKYLCPKCGISYCSVDCFKAEQHLQCSEAFYKKCVKEELQCLENDSDSRIKMLEILRRSQNDTSEDSLDSDDDEYDEKSDISKRMENVNLDDGDNIWENLNLNEKREFRKLIANGEIIKILPDWNPWWIFNKKKKLINEVEFDEEIGMSINIPEHQIDIPPFEQLTKTKPADTVPFMIANVLMSYAYTARWFKGNHCEMPIEGITTLVALSSAMRNSVFRNVIEAYEAFSNDLVNCKWMKKNQIDEELIGKDLVSIVTGVDNKDTYFSIKVCLSDIYSMILKASSELKEAPVLQPARFTGSPPTTRELKLLSKKIMYYLSWTVTYGEQLKNIIGYNIS